MSPDGRYVYVANGGGLHFFTKLLDLLDDATHGSVSVIDTATRAMTTTFELDGDYPSDAAINPDGHLIYVAIGDSNSTSVIDTAANNTAARVSLGHKGLLKTISEFVNPDDNFGTGHGGSTGSRSSRSRSGFGEPPSQGSTEENSVQSK